MNLRSKIRMYVSFALAFAIVAACAITGGIVLAIVGGVVWAVLEQLAMALQPVSFMPAARGAQATSGMYRGWAAKLVAGLGFAKGRSVQADLVRLESGVTLSVVSYGLHDGSQTMGYLLLHRSVQEGTTVAWVNRGKGQQVHPIDNPGTMSVHEGRQQQNSVQKRYGHTVSVQLGTGSYWVREHDAELLKLLFAQKSEVVSPTV